jgi:hypothetical protein
MMQRVFFRVDGQEFETVTVDEPTADQLVVDLQDSLTSDTVVDIPLNAVVGGELRQHATVSVAGRNVTTLLVAVEPYPGTQPTIG